MKLLRIKSDLGIVLLSTWGDPTPKGERLPLGTIIAPLGVSEMRNSLGKAERVFTFLLPGGHVGGWTARDYRGTCYRNSPDDLVKQGLARWIDSPSSPR